MGLTLRQSTIVNGTNTITIKGSALSYIEGDSNFMHLLTNMSGSTISITGSNVGILSTNTTINGTVKFPNITNSNNNNLVTYNSSTGQLYYFSTSSISVGTASYVNPLIQDVKLTGSLYVTSSGVTLGQFIGNQNGYVEFSVRNTSTGVSASGDIAIYADNGTVTNNYIDMGINNSGLSNTYFYGGTDFGNANDAYLYNVGGNLRIGNATSQAPFSQSLFIFSNPSATPDITITGSRVGIQKTGSLNAALDISGSAIVSGSLNVTNGITGSLLGTSSYATTSSYALTVQGGLNNYIPLWTGSTQLTSSLIYQSGSNIGIGITSPSYSLDVRGNGRFTSTLWLDAFTVGGSTNLSFIRPTDGAPVVALSMPNNTTLRVGGGNINFADVYTANNFTARFSDYTANSSHALTTAGGLFVSGTSTVYSNIDYLFKVIGDGGSGVMNINNVLQVSGSRTTITGSLIVSGSQTFIGSSTSTGIQIVTGSLITSGSQTLIGTTSLTGSLSVSGSTLFIGTHTLSGSNTITGNTVMSGSIEVSGSSNFHNSIFIVTGSTFIKGVTQISGSTGITGSFDVVDGNINIVSGSSFLRWGNKLFNYAQFANTSSISVTQNVSGAFAFPLTYFGDGVSIVSSSRITFTNTGLYNIQFSALANQGVGTANLHIWFRKTGSNIDNSDTLVTLSNNTQTLAAWNFAYPFSASEYAEIIYHSSAANTSFPYNAAGSGFPAAPSIICTITQIA